VLGALDLVLLGALERAQVHDKEMMEVPVLLLVRA